MSPTSSSRSPSTLSRDLASAPGQHAAAEEARPIRSGADGEVPLGDWDMTAYFPSFDGDVYRAFRETLARDAVELLGDLEAMGPRIGADEVEAWGRLLARLEEVQTRRAHLGGYLGCIGAADSRNERITREAARAAADQVALEQCFVRVRAVLRETPAELRAELARRPELEGAGYFLRRLERRGTWSMEPQLELLASELDVTGMGAFGRLYSQVAGSLEFDLEVAGQARERVPVSRVRGLLESPSADVRWAALRGSNTAWERVGDVTAACLNAIAGSRRTLYARRGIDHFLDPALFGAGIERETLDTLLAVVRARAEVARRYLRTKAQLFGRERLGFQDLLAPLPEASAAGDASGIPWETARSRILDAFGAFYPELERFARSAFERRWIDHAPRRGKRPGAFCSTSSWIGESRVFATYGGTLGDLSTVAHELGHAFHGYLMRDLRPWARQYPMTLAETASTFAEQLVIDAVLDDPAADGATRRALIDSRMQDAATFLLNIPMRFAFEHAFYTERAEGEVPVSRCNQLMLEAQEEWYQDSLDPAERDPWFWSSKLHFYLTGTSFYNFPYTFGYLLSLGIFARARQAGPGFLPEYEALLRLTGSDTAENVVQRTLGVDLRRPEFWNASIDLIDAEMSRFEKEVSGHYAT